MTRSELLERAKVLNIKGRHELAKEALEAAIEAHSPLKDPLDAVVKEFEREAEQATATKKDLKEVVRRYPSLRKRDPVTKRVIRAGNNLSSNKPFKRKYYYLATFVAAHVRKIAAGVAHKESPYDDAYYAAPKQLRGLLTYMADHCADPANPQLGTEIGERAKGMGYVESKIPGDRLFAYYRKALEVLGVIHYKEESQ
jgi:hypothetical protein